MKKKPYILTLDQGTTSSRSLLYSPLEQKIIALEQIEFAQHFPHNGWVEHDLDEIWQTTLEMAKRVIEKTGSLSQIEAIGITNQRETTALWNGTTDKPLYRAIVWQDRRTADRCQVLKEQGWEPMVRKKTGLFLDPYFCASKIEWLLAHIPGSKNLVDQGHLKFGTIDSFLLWKLTGGKQHACDTTNASRTGLFDIHLKKWDRELLQIYGIHPSILPQVKPSNSFFGLCSSRLFGREIPIYGMVGDQQSSLFGHLGFDQGVAKATYGTGAFLLVNTGPQPILSQANLLTTLGYDLLIQGQEMTHYALEGSIFIAGALLKWLKENLNFIDRYDELDRLDWSHSREDSVVVVPALSGLGAPHWVPEARGMILGLTRDSDRNSILKASLKSIALQTHDILSSVKAEGISLSSLKIDGGVSKNDHLGQFMADLLEIPIKRPDSVEVTAVGAALMASLGCGIFTRLNELEASGKERIFSPNSMDRKMILADWHRAVSCVKQFAQK